jgi:hypothetical protein
MHRGKTVVGTSELAKLIQDDAKSPAPEKK